MDHLSDPGKFQAPELTESSTLDDYLLYALAANPALKASYHRWEAAVQQAPQAGALPNPRLGYGYFLRQVETRVGPQVQRFGLSQAFPWFGKLSLAESKAAKAARAAGRKFEADRVELYRKVRVAYYDYWFLGRRIEITQSNLALLEQTEEIASNRYSTGSGGFSQLIKVQVEMGKLEDGIATLEDLATSHAAAFNALLGRDTGLPLPFPAAIDTTAVVQSPAELEQLLVERNPELARLRELQGSAEDGVRLAGKQRWPDVMVGLDYIQTDESEMPNIADNGRDPLIASVSINLPLSFGKYEAAEKQAASRLGALRQQEMDMTNMLSARLKQAVVDLDDADRKVDLYGSTLVPKAEQSLEAAITALSAGKADALDVLDAQRTLLDFQLELERSLAALAKSVAEIEALTGETLNIDRAAQAHPEGGN
ncbi:MAG: TolC family protein [Candidatus Glassbacteria bacterium]|nr:TolC family protein [Candidatus Glassbacteria bacterium]